MPNQLHDTGEEFIVDVLFDGLSVPASVDIGLYNDSTDSLADTGDIGDITTEPSGGSYARQSASIPADFTNSDNSGDWETVIAQQSFDTSDSTQSVDSYFVVVNFQADDTSDGAPTDHLFFTGSLDQSRNLSDIDTFNLSNTGVSIT